MNCTCMYHSLIRYILDIFGCLKNALGLRRKDNDNHLNNNFTLTFVIGGQSEKNTISCDKMLEEYECNNQCCEKSSENLETKYSCHVCCKSKKVTNKCSVTKNSNLYCCKKQLKTVDICSSNQCERPETSETRQLDKKNKICDKMLEEYQCKNQCCEKSSESLESSNNCYVCCKSKKVTTKCSATKNCKIYSYKKPLKTVDICSSNHCERLETSESNIIICSKLSFIIKRLDHLIDTYPSQNKSPNDCSATNQTNTQLICITNTNSSSVICGSMPSCNKEAIKNKCDTSSQKSIIPVKTCEMPVKSLPDTKSFNDCSANNQPNTQLICITDTNSLSGMCGSKSSCNKEAIKNECDTSSQKSIILVETCEMPVKSLPETKSLNDCSTNNQPNTQLICITDTNPLTGICGSKLSCNKELVKNECEKPPQETVVTSVNSCEMPIKCILETKVQPTQSKTQFSVDIPSNQNLITPIDCNKSSDYELQSIELCIEEDKNQKQDCTIDINSNIIKDDDTNNNISTDVPVKPKLPVPVKTIKTNNNITKPNTSSKQKPGTYFDQIKVKQNNKNIQSSHSEKKYK